MSVEPINIEIFGRSLQVNCPAEQKDALYKAADYLEEQLKKLKIRTKVNNLEHLLFIAALNVCNELEQEKLKSENFSVRVEQQINTLKETLEKALLDKINRD